VSICQAIEVVESNEASRPDFHHGLLLLFQDDRIREGLTLGSRAGLRGGMGLAVFGNDEPCQARHPALACDRKFKCVVVNLLCRSRFPCDILHGLSVQGPRDRIVLCS
jgi:hypothetical protein